MFSFVSDFFLRHQACELHPCCSILFHAVPHGSMLFHIAPCCSTLFDAVAHGCRICSHSSKVMVLSLEWVSESPAEFKTHIADPTVRVSDAGGLGRAREFVFLTSSQLLLVVVV